VAAESGPPFRNHSLVLLGLALATVYLVWQVIPLARRMDAVERSQLEIRDRLLAKMDRLEAEVIAAGPAAEPPPVRAAPRETRAPRAEGPAEGAAGGVAAPSTPAVPPRARVDLYGAERYLSRRLFPDDAAIALLMLEGVPPAEMARRLKHSVAFINAKGIQIEKQLAAKPDAPPEILAGIREAVDHARGGR
jgi:hypothetical protein